MILESLTKDIYKVKIKTIKPVIGNSMPYTQLLDVLQKEYERVEKAIASEEKRLKSPLPEDHPLVISLQKLKTEIERVQEQIDELGPERAGIQLLPRDKVQDVDRPVLGLRAHHIKGVLKEVAQNFVSAFVTSARNLVSRYFVVEPDFIPFVRQDGSYVFDSDGVLSRAVTGVTAQGPRRAINISEYVNPTLYLEFTVKVIGAGQLHPYTEEVIREMFIIAEEYGGLLGWRNSDEYGKFRLVEFDLIEHVEPGENAIKPRQKRTRRKVT